MNFAELQNFLPENGFPFIEKWMKICPCKILIKKERKTKLGDFRSIGNKAEYISVNYTDKKDLLFFVLTHEIAHLHVFHTYKHSVLPHGKEWKLAYQKLLLESLSVYEKNFQILVADYARNPKASFGAYPAIAKYFISDELDEWDCFVEDLKPQQKFEFRNKHFQVIDKQKKRFKCTELKTNRTYLFSALAKVKPLE